MIDYSTAGVTRLGVIYGKHFRYENGRLLLGRPNNKMASLRLSQCVHRR